MRRRKGSSESEAMQDLAVGRSYSILQQAFWKKPIALFHEEQAHEELQRTLGLFDLIMIGIGGTVGTGVFATAGFIASSYAGPAAVFSWIISGFGCILSGVSFMELSVVLPSAGSTYAYSYFALGELPAMIAGFLLTLEYGVSSAGGARSWSDKFVALLHSFDITPPSWLKQTHFDVYAAALQFLCVSIVLSGTSTGKRFVNIITVTKITIVLFIIFGGLIFFNDENITPMVPPSQLNNSSKLVFGWPGVMLGASASFYGYIGYDEVCCLAGEAKNPTYAIPRAVIATVIGAAFLSTMATFALVGMVPYNEIDSEAAYGAAFERMEWLWAKRFVELGEVITMPVGVLIGFLAQPRLQYAMAKDGLLPSIFAKVDNKGTIFWGTLISGVLLIVTSLTVQFEVLWDFISLGILLAFNMTNVSVVVTRLRDSRPILSSCLLGSFCLTSFLSAYMWQKGVIAHPIDQYDMESVSMHIRHWNWILAIILSILSFLLVTMLWWFCPKSISQSAGFQVPFLPWTPCIAISFNWFLFVQMESLSFLLIALWVILAAIVYLVYGTTHGTSRSHIRGSNKMESKYEMVCPNDESYE